MKKSKRVDYKLIFCIILLLAFGLVVLKSATLSLPSGNRILKSQIVATILGLIAMIVLSFIDYRIWKKIYKPIYVFSVILLVITLIFGIGPTRTSEIHSWLKIGPVTFQPSEFVKIAYIICVSAFIEDNYEDLNEIKTLLKIIIFSGIPIGLILLQPDAGTAMVYMFIFIVIIFLAGISWKYIGAVVGLGLLAAPIFWMNLEQYQKNRFFDFLNPESDPSGTGYQYVQGRIAIGSGKITGKGLYKGTQNQYGFIPEKQNDFIFPVLVEELGFIGGLSLMALYIFLLYRLVNISRESKDHFGSFIVIGIAALLIFHIWENLGMTLGVMPITGIPLPFISSGGTFQLTNLAMIGLALSISRYKNKDSKF